MLSVPAGMTDASTDDVYFYMELKKKRFENMEREIRQGSAMESDAHGMSAPAATELPVGCSRRASDIPRSEIRCLNPGARFAAPTAASP
jgi:hypothetical protein